MTVQSTHCVMGNLKSRSDKEMIAAQRDFESLPSLAKSAWSLNRMSSKQKFTHRHFCKWRRASFTIIHGSGFCPEMKNYSPRANISPKSTSISPPKVFQLHFLRICTGARRDAINPIFLARKYKYKKASGPGLIRFTPFIPF